MAWPTRPLLAIAAVLLAGCSALPPPGQGASGGPVTGDVTWWNDAVFYEVFVRSFFDSDDDGIGDLAGLTAKLDYLNDGDPATDDDLGVTALWLMPVAESPSYHGYDTTDYYSVARAYGSNEDFKELVEQAHTRGIKVIVDLVLNHTSDQHPWFTESARGPDSPKRDWYVWRADDPQQRTAWGSTAWHPLNGAHYLGLFWSGMPDLNYRNPAVTEQMHDVARFWLAEMSADGFRLDAVRHLIEKDGDFQGTPETHQWLVTWDDYLDSLDPEALTVGEVWDETSVVAPYVTGDEVDLAFEFALAEAILAGVGSGDATAFTSQLGTVLAAYPAGQFAPFLSNHDQSRTMTRLLGDIPAAKLAASALLTLPGVPFIYYGEEIGMRGQKPDELIRTPMQWSAADAAGFSTGTAWQPPNGDFELVNVASQADDPDSLLSHYRRLIRLRADHTALRTGGLQILSSTCPAAHAQLRTSANADRRDDLLVLLSFSPEAQPDCAVSLPASDLPAGTFTGTDLLTGQPVAELTVGAGGAISKYVPVPALAGRQGVVVELSPQGQG